MLWSHYIFRRGDGVHDMWDRLYQDKNIDLLYICGRGFDVRAIKVLKEFIGNLKTSGCTFDKAELLLVDFSGYQLSEELKKQTEKNAEELESLFKEIGTVKSVSIGPSAGGEDDISTSSALKHGLDSVLSHLNTQTDVILDISSLPRVVYLSIMMGILHRLIPDKSAENPLLASNINFQVLVAEDVQLDNKIQSEEPSNDLVLIPGYSSVLHAESVQDWPLVWFPVLGENRVNQFNKVVDLALIPDDAEICPVLPHPSRNPRRADQLLIEYKKPLFDDRQTPTSNILLAHESHPFEAYRQLLTSMKRYLESMRIISGCRLVVTPLASKLITIGVGLACFEMRTENMGVDRYGVAIPYAEPTRYSIAISDLIDSNPEISSLLLTGEAYSY